MTGASRNGAPADHRKWNERSVPAGATRPAPCSCCAARFLVEIPQNILQAQRPIDLWPLSAFAQHATRVPTVTNVQSDGDLRLIPSGCVIHKASSLPTRSLARRLSPPFHLISFGAAVARSGLSKEGLDGRPSVPHGFPTVAVLGERETIVSLLWSVSAYCCVVLLELCIVDQNLNINLKP